MTEVAYRPQGGPQETFLSSPADITFYGGAAGGGKTWALLFSPLRHVRTPGFNAVIFRNTREEIRKPGGMWDESMAMYPARRGYPREGTLDWTFRNEGAQSSIQFDGIQHEKDLDKWKSSQLAYIGYDQVETISRKKFFYMLSRNRSNCGVRPYIQASCNPDPDSWVAEFIGWWIGEDGFPIEERSGVLRWFVNIKDTVHWGDSAEELITKLGIPGLPHDHYEQPKPLSVTFIPALTTDNKIGLAKDPMYISKLRAMPLVDQQRLEHGNWKIRPAAGLYFRREWCRVVEEVPAGVNWVRAYDLAATEPTPDNPSPAATVGVKMGVLPDRRLIIGHAFRVQSGPFEVREAIKNMASQDGDAVAIHLPQDPGQAGKDQVAEYVRMLMGYTVRSSPETGDKVTRFGAVSSQAKAHNLMILKGDWNEWFFQALEQFPQGGLDEGDACSRALQALVSTDMAIIDYLLSTKAQANAQQEHAKLQPFLHQE